MERQDIQSAYNDIVAHIEKQSGQYETWFVDTTSDWKNTIFKKHGVPLKGHWWMVRHCYTPIAAKSVKESLSELGCKVGPNANLGRDVVYVYAYLISDATKQGDEKEEEEPANEPPSVTL
ncbi:MAG: hypothetical protein WC958_00190 [Dehalococcoidales bacterium]